MQASLEATQAAIGTVLRYCTIALQACAASIARGDERTTATARHAFGALLDSVLKVHSVATNDPRCAPAMTIPTLSSAMASVQRIIEGCAYASDRRAAFLGVLGQVIRVALPLRFASLGEFARACAQTLLRGWRVLVVHDAPGTRESERSFTSVVAAGMFDDCFRYLLGAPRCGCGVAAWTAAGMLAAVLEGTSTHSEDDLQAAIRVLMKLGKARGERRSGRVHRASRHSNRQTHNLFTFGPFTCLLPAYVEAVLMVCACACAAGALVIFAYGCAAPCSRER